MQAACALEQIMRDGYEYDVQECLRSMCVGDTRCSLMFWCGLQSSYARSACVTTGQDVST